MKIGDTLTEEGHSIYKISAYAGYTGIVKEIYHGGGFYISNGTSNVVVGCSKNVKKQKIILNGKEIIHYFNK